MSPRTLTIYALCAACLLPSVLSAEEKPTVAVLTLKNTSGVTEGETQIISDRLRVELFRTGNVHVMEREQMDVVLRERDGRCTTQGRPGASFHPGPARMRRVDWKDPRPLFVLAERGPFNDVPLALALATPS